MHSLWKANEGGPFLGAVHGHKKKSFIRGFCFGKFGWIEPLFFLCPLGSVPRPKNIYRAHPPEHLSYVPRHCVPLIRTWLSCNWHVFGHTTLVGKKFDAGRLVNHHQRTNYILVPATEFTLKEHRHLVAPARTGNTKV